MVYSGGAFPPRFKFKLGGESPVSGEDGDLLLVLELPLGLIITLLQIEIC